MNGQAEHWRMGKPKSGYRLYAKPTEQAQSGCEETSSHLRAAGMQQDFDKIQQKSLRAVTVSDVVDAAGRETRKGQADDE